MILLMLLPAISIGLFFYIGHPVATGAAIIEENVQNNLLGTYTIKPSFEARVGYDIEDYEKIDGSMQVITDCMSMGLEFEKCIENLNVHDDVFSWSIDCNKGPEKILYDISEFYKSCSGSDDSGCICTKSFDYTQDEITKYKISNADYKIRVIQDLNNRKIFFNLAEPYEIMDVVSSDVRSRWDPNLMIISFRKEKLVDVKMFFKDELAGISYENPFVGSKKIALYKHKINDIEMIDFVQIKNEEIITPSREKEISENIRECNLKGRHEYKICATRKDYKIPSYDELDKKVKQADIVYNFAVRIDK